MPGSGFHRSLGAADKAGNVQTMTALKKISFPLES